MQRRRAAILASTVFVLVALVAAIFADSFDQQTPVALSAKGVMHISFDESVLAGPDAFGALTERSSEDGLYLVRVSPSVHADAADVEQGSEIFVPLNPERGWPRSIGRFSGGSSSAVEPPASLKYSPPSGTYLLTGDSPDLASFGTWAGQQQVRYSIRKQGLSDVPQLVLRDQNFTLGLASLVGLMVSIGLYWVATRARGRAVRLLNGESAGRIQAEDLTGFASAAVVAAIGVGALASLAVGFRSGWEFVPFYSRTYAVLSLWTLLLAFGVSFALSNSAWPSTRSLADRTPPVAGLARATRLVRLSTFALVLVAVGPAIGTYRNASDISADLNRWDALADVVGLTYPGLSDQALVDLGPAVAEVAENENTAVLMSYALTVEQGFAVTPDTPVVFVNQRWIDRLLTPQESAGLKELSVAELDPTLAGEVRDQLEVWIPSKGSVDALLEAGTVYRWQASTGFPTMLAGGSLDFPSAPTVIVIDDFATTLTPDTVVSMSSTNNVLFQGVDSTRAALKSVGVDGTVQVEFVAEAGRLMARYARYDLWVSTTAVLGLLIALVVACGVGGQLAAVATARRDFAGRLSGASWVRMAASSVAGDAAAMTMLALIVLWFGRHTIAPLAVLGFAITVMFAGQVGARKSVFGRVVARQI